MSLFASLKAAIIAFFRTLTTSANVVHNVARVGELQSQNLLAETALEGYTELTAKHGEKVAEKLTTAMDFYSSLSTAVKWAVAIKPNN